MSSYSIACRRYTVFGPFLSVRALHATPTAPVANRKMVVGSGTGAGVSGDPTCPTSESLKEVVSLTTRSLRMAPRGTATGGRHRALRGAKAACPWDLENRRQRTDLPSRLPCKRNVKGRHVGVPLIQNHLHKVHGNC